MAPESRETKPAPMTTSRKMRASQTSEPFPESGRVRTVFFAGAGFTLSVTGRSIKLVNLQLLNRQGDKRQAEYRQDKADQG